MEQIKGHRGSFFGLEPMMSNGRRWRVVPIGVWEKFLDLTWNLSFEIEGGRIDGILTRT